MCGIKGGVRSQQLGTYVRGTHQPSDELMYATECETGCTSCAILLIFTLQLYSMYISSSITPHVQRFILIRQWLRYTTSEVKLHTGKKKKKKKRMITAMYYTEIFWVSSHWSMVNSGSAGYQSLLLVQFLHLENAKQDL